MNFYRATSKETFISEIAEYLTSHFNGQFDDVKVILPHGHLCSVLQETLIKNFGSLLLPEIITLSELAAEEEGIFKIPSEIFGVLSQIEEQIILTEIINEYKPLSYNKTTSARLALPLARLFYELIINKVDISELKQIPGIDQASHWEDIYKFLSFAYDKWINTIHSKGLLSRAERQIIIYQAELDRIKNNGDKHLIIAGEFGANIAVCEFMGEVLKKRNGHIIIPPFPKDITKLENLKADHPLYPMQQFLKLHDLSINDCKMLSEPESTIMDGLFFNRLDYIPNHNKQKIEYITFNDIYTEAEFLASKCSDILFINPNTKIAVICPNTNNKNIYQEAILRRNLPIKDLIGMSLTETNAINFLFDLADLLCNEFEIKNFIKFLSNPEFICYEAILIKNTLLKKNRFIKSWEELEELIGDNSWFKNIQHELKPIDSKIFHSILQELTTRMQQLSPGILNKYKIYKLSDSLHEIASVKWSLQLSSPADFPKLFREIIKNSKILPSNTVHAKKGIESIFLCRAGDVSLANFDVKFLIDCSEGNLPPKIQENPWINRYMQDELGINLNSRQVGSALYNFYLNLQGSELFITRSKKQFSNKELLESSYIMKLKTIVPDISCFIGKSISKAPKKNIKNKEEYVYANSFPRQISVTDIETLVRSPYNFYAKKILGLRPINKIDERPNLAEFGSYIHAVIEEYTKYYNKTNLLDTKDVRRDKFCYFANNIIQNITATDNSKFIWYTKAKAIAEEFVEFDYASRSKKHRIYTESRGEWNLNIAGHELKIVAIADRIEVDDKGKVAIIDYKTGATPTKKEVLSGLSPQLLIEAMMVQADVFKEIKGNVNFLYYVKINSNAPYIRVNEISISQDELEEHKKACLSLLEHYIINSKYTMTPCLMKYDEYTHLARRDLVLQ